MFLLTDEKKINTIYIISKGRPNCTTARTLEKIKYPGEWFIVCGNNDETVPEYKKNFGEEKVLVFDWYEEIKHTNTLDNFGFESKASGACPVRNATRKISESRGELRHWQFDDDYVSFQRYKKSRDKNTKINGESLFYTLYKIAEYGLSANLKMWGFALQRVKQRQIQGKHLQNVYLMPTTFRATRNISSNGLEE